MEPKLIFDVDVGFQIHLLVRLVRTLDYDDNV